MNRLKVAFVLDDSLDRPDGVQQYVKSLGGWLASQGHTVHYLVGQSVSDGATIHSLSRNVAVRFNKNRLTIPLPASRSRIAALLREQNYDVLHVQMPYSPLLAGQVIAAAPAHTAVVGTFHILPFGRLQQVGSKALAVVQKRSLKRFDAICSVSAAAQTFAKSHFGLTTTVIPNMVETRRFVSLAKQRPGRIVFLGRLVPRKGCLELLQALQGVTYKEVLIAGGGEQRQKLEAFVADNGLKNVTFLGKIPEADKADLLASAQLAVFPSLGGESFGIVLIEAMAAGSGVVLGGNNPGYASVLGDWPTTLVNSRDTKAFSATLQHFLDNTKAREALHAKQQQAVKRYDVAIAGREVETMYVTALQSRKDVP